MAKKRSLLSDSLWRPNGQTHSTQGKDYHEHLPPFTKVPDATRKQDIAHPKFQFYLKKADRKGLGPRWAYSQFKMWQENNGIVKKVHKKSKEPCGIRDMKEKYGDLNERFKFLIKNSR